jgi:hypothetical protein
MLSVSGEIRLKNFGKLENSKQGKEHISVEDFVIHYNAIKNSKAKTGLETHNLRILYNV